MSEVELHGVASDGGALRGKRRGGKGASAGGRLNLVRHAVQAAAFALFAAPMAVAGWSLFGGTQPVQVARSTPADLPFFGTLSSSSAAGVDLLDPFAALQVVAASKSFDPAWLLCAAPVLAVYGLVRGRAFCGWVCPVNAFLELVDALRGRLGIEVEENPVPRRFKVWFAIVVLVLSALLSIPLFEAFSPVSFLNKGLVLGSSVGGVTLGAIVVAELFWGRRVWCRSICPLGGFYEVVGRFSLLNVRINHAACIDCGKCKQACICSPEILDPAIEGRDDFVSAGDCMACGKCVGACPTDALEVGWGRPRA